MKKIIKFIAILLISLSSNILGQTEESNITQLISLVKPQDSDNLIQVNPYVLRQSEYVRTKQAQTNNKIFHSENINYIQTNLNFSETLVLVNLLYLKAFPKYEHYFLRCEDLVKNLNMEQIFRIYTEATGFFQVDLPLLPKLIIEFLIPEIRLNLNQAFRFMEDAIKVKENLETCIKDYFNPIAREAIAKEYFYLYGDVNTIPFSYNVFDKNRDIQFLNVGIDYGFSIQELVDNGKIPKIIDGIGGTRRLDLSNLKIKSLDGIANIKDIRSIANIDLSHNLIENISNRDFKDICPTILYLDHNLISSIGPNCFDNLFDLAILALNDNPDFYY